MNMQETLKGQVAFVTGASRGIGAAIVQALGQRGATIVGADINEAAADEVQKVLDAAGFAGQGVVLDVTDGAACEAVIGEVEKRFGAVTILVNNAGITRDNLAMRMKDDEWDAVINTNLKSVFRLSKLVLRGMMKARTGRIINISSVVAASGNPGQINYAASKAGVAGLSRSLAQEVGSRNITVNCVAPGFIDTAMTRALSEEQRNLLIGKIPMGRLGQVEDIANAVAFLAGPEASYITGTMLHVNGGMYMV
jgi:3-oxoacyl-[acyl-carrier protein] reductase